MTTSRLDSHLQSLGALPDGLLARAMALAALNQAFQAWLAPHGDWAKQVALAHIEAQTVKLTTASAAAATRIRFSESAILNWFTVQTGQPLSCLKVSVRAAQGLGLKPV
jgi:hypothetical protein